MNLKELALELEMEQEEILELLEIFLQSSESDLNGLQNPLEDDDAKQVADAAHSIKGASAILGFMDIFSIAKSIEHKARNNSLTDLRDDILIIKDRLSVIAKAIDEL